MPSFRIILLLLLGTIHVAKGQDEGRVAVQLQLNELEIRNTLPEVNSLLNTSIVYLNHNGTPRNVRIHASMEIQGTGGAYFGVETDPHNLYTQQLSNSRRDAITGAAIRASEYTSLVGMNGTNPDAYITSTGMALPTGVMRVCIKVFDEFGLNDITDYGNDANTNCVEIPVNIYQPPQVVHVQGVHCGSATPLLSADGTNRPPITVNFLPTGMNNMSGSIPADWSYEMVLLHLGEEDNLMDPNQAFQAVSVMHDISYDHPLVIASNGGPANAIGMQLTLNTSHYNEEMIPGHHYAVFVRVKDNSGAPLSTVENGGLGQPCTFVYGGSSLPPTGGLSLEGFPTNGSYMPYMGMAVMVRFEPYDNRYSGADYDLSLSGPGISGLNYIRNPSVNWGTTGPRNAQSRALGYDVADGSVISQEHAQHLVLSPTDPRDVNWNSALQTLTRGETYDYKVNFTMKHRDRTIPPAALENHFKAGMPPSELMFPEATHAAGTVRFKFRPANTDKISRLPFDQMFRATFQNRWNSTYMTKVTEALVLEISKEEDFKNIFLRDTVNFYHNIGMSYTDPFYADITRSREFEHHLDAGTYYWRTRWIKNQQVIDRFLAGTATGFPPNDLDYYSVSEIRKLVIGDPSSEPVATAPEPELQECDCDLQFERGQASPVTLAINQTVNIGRFELKIARITGGDAAAGYTGDGTIENFSLYGFSPKVAVSFSGLKAVTGTGGRARAFEGTAISRSRTGIPALEGSSPMSWFDDILRASLDIGSGELHTPFGLNSEVDHTKIMLVMEEIKFTPQKAEVKAKAGYKMPGEFLGSAVVFQVSEACIVPAGNNNPGGFAQAVTFSLAENLSLGNTNNQQEYSVRLKGGSEGEITSLKFDCNGFSSLVIAGEVLFSRESLVPEDNTGKRTEGQVTASFAAKVQKGESGSHGLIAELNFPKSFQFTALEGFGVTVSNAILDLSEAANDDAMAQLPDTLFTDAASRRIWTGFYLKQMSFRLPSEFKNGPDPFEVGIKDILIDNNGLSGTAFAGNLVHTSGGKVDVFYFTLDEISISFRHNTCQSGKMKGKLGLPIFEKNEEQYFEYHSTLAFEPGKSPQFNFAITPPTTGDKKLEISMWKIARIELNEGTKASLYIGEKSGVEFELNGKLAFEGKYDDWPVEVRIPDIEVQGLRFSTLPQPEGQKQAGLRDIKIDGKSVMAFSNTSSGSSSGGTGETSGRQNASNQSSAGGFSMGINKIDFDTGAGDILHGAIYPKLTVSFQISLADVITIEEIDLGIKTKVAIVNTNGGSEMKFDFEEVVGPQTIKVKGEIGGVELDGCLKFIDEADNKGASGSIKAKIPMLGQIGVAATFGEKKDHLGSFNYFNIQAMYKSDVGITLFAGVNLYGLSGGVWHHMRIKSPSEGLVNSLGTVANGTGAAFGRESNESEPNGSASNGAGETLCGLTLEGGNMEFEADRSIVLGLTFGAYFGCTGSPTTYNFDVHLTATAMQQPPEAGGGLGINYIAIQGNLNVMNNFGPPNVDAPLVVNAGVTFAWEKTYNADLTTTEKVDIQFKLKVLLKAGPVTVLKGQGTDNEALEARFHANSSTGEWYFTMGNPKAKDRTGEGLIFSLLGDTKMSAYFFAGANTDMIPTELPDIPSDLAWIMAGNKVADNSGTSVDTGEMSTISNPRPETARPGVKAGVGFGFYVGAGIDLNFLIFYADIRIQIGFDVAMAEYAGGPCRDLPESQSEWYAKGQAYAGIKGEFGIGVDLIFIKGKFPIVELEAGLILQAGLPNPAYFRGNVGLRYSILGGMVSGQCNFKLDIGDKCQNTDLLGGIQFIDDFTPANNKRDVSVYSSARASFSYPIEKTFAIIDDEGTTHHFRPYIKQMHIKDEQGNILTQPYQLSEENYVATARISEKLGVRKNLTAYCEVGVRHALGNNRWEEYNFQEDRTNTFTTEAVTPLLFSDDLIAYTWPIKGQRHFLKNEARPDIPSTAGKGIIRFKYKEDKFRASSSSRPMDPGAISYTYFIRFAGPNGKISEQQLTDFGNAVEQVNFDIPRNLQNNTHYTIILTRRATGGLLAAGLDSTLKSANLNGNGQLSQKDTDDNKTLIRQYKLPRETLPPDEKIMYMYSFRTSRYNTAAEKLAGISMEGGSRISTGERFDIYEVRKMENNPLTPLFTVNLLPSSQLRSHVYNVTNKFLDRFGSGQIVTDHSHNRGEFQRFVTKMQDPIFLEAFGVNDPENQIESVIIPWTGPNRDGHSGVFHNSPFMSVSRADRYWWRSGFMDLDENSRFEVYTKYKIPGADLDPIFNSSVVIENPAAALSNEEVNNSVNILENMSRGATTDQGIPPVLSQSALTMTANSGAQIIAQKRTATATRPVVSVPPNIWGVTLISAPTAHIVSSAALQRKIPPAPATPSVTPGSSRPGAIPPAPAPNSPQVTTTGMVSAGLANTAFAVNLIVTPNASFSLNQALGEPQQITGNLITLGGASHRVSDHVLSLTEEAYDSNKNKIMRMSPLITPGSGFLSRVMPNLTTPSGIFDELGYYLMRTRHEINNSLISGLKSFQIGYGVSPSGVNRKTLSIGQ